MPGKNCGFLDPVLVASSSNSPEKLLPQSNEDDVDFSQEIQSQQSEVC